MQRKRLFTYFLLLLLISGLSFWLIKQQTNSTLKGRSSKFAIVDTDEIDRVVIKDKDEQTLELGKKADGYWLVNQRYAVGKNAIRSLLHTLNKITISRPVSQAELNSVNKGFEPPLKTVFVYKKGETEAFHSFELAGAASSNKGTYARLSASDTPYVIGLRTFQGHLLTRFSTIEKHWRDKTVFDLLAKDIKSVEIAYPYSTKDGFLLSVVEKDSFQIRPLLPDVKSPKGYRFNKPLAIHYLNSFKEVYAEAFENSHPKIDSIKKQQPYCIVNIQSQQGKQYKMVVHYMPINKRSKKQFEEDGTPIKYDLDRYFAFIRENEDMVMIQQFVFGKLFKKYNDFFWKPE